MTDLQNRRRMLMRTQSGLPSEYQRVEYLLGTGTQWIDMEYVFTTELSEMGISLLTSWINQSDDSGTNKVIGTLNNYAAWVRFGSNSFIYEAGGRRTPYAPSAEWIKNNIVFSLIFWRDESRTYCRWDTASQDYTIDNGGSIVDGLSVYLFTANLNGAVSPREIRVYSAYIKDNGIMVRDIIPCCRKSDNKPGMYDLVSGRFFVNQGTGEFGYETLDGTIVNPQ